MIIFKQLPLKELDTFEEELLFLIADVVVSIRGIGSKSLINADGIVCCHFTLADNTEKYKEFVDYFTKMVNLCRKYDKSFQGIFEITLKRGLNSRWELDIKE